jgi:hypothetical protein
MKYLSKKIIILILALWAGGVHYAYSATTKYTLLEPLSEEIGQTPNMGEYLKGVFNLSIGLATVLAVLMIVIGGIKYMTAEAFTGKSDAKEMISRSIYGLVLILSSFLILTTINPNLVEFDLNLKKLEVISNTTDPTTQKIQRKEVVVGTKDLLTFDECSEVGYEPGPPKEKGDEFICYEICETPRSFSGTVYTLSSRDIEYCYYNKS